MTMEDLIEEAKGSNVKDVILDAIKDEDWRGTNEDMLFLGKVLKKAFPEAYAGEEGNRRLETYIRKIIEENPVSASGTDEFSLEASGDEKEYTKTNQVASWGIRGNRMTNLEVYKKDGELFYTEDNGQTFKPLPEGVTPTNAAQDATTATDFNVDSKIKEMEESITASINPSNIKQRYDNIEEAKKGAMYSRLLNELTKNRRLNLDGAQAVKVLNKILGI